MHGERVKEGIEKQVKEIEAIKAESHLPGRESGQTKYGEGSLAANEATKDAVKKSHKADPY